jgi:hypothetical protein
MKKMIFLLIIGGAFATQGWAANPDSHNSATAITKTTRGILQRQVDEMLRPERVDRTRIYRLGNLSSRPWAQIGGTVPQTYFVDASYTQPRFNLFWLGAAPQ